MSTLSVRLPDSIHGRLKALAKREGVSINQLIVTALAEKLSALDTEEYLQTRAKRATKGRFRKALRAVPDVAPDDADQSQGTAGAERPKAKGKGQRPKGKRGRAEGRT